MAGRDQALSLLAAANNHGDLAVKLSSLKQAKDIIMFMSSADPSMAAELLPYLVQLQSSPETLVRKALIEVIDEIGLRGMEHSSILMPTLLTSLRDEDSTVARKSIITGTNIFCSMLYELSFQFHRRGMVERWLEELWTWMIKFKDAVFGIPLEAGSVGTKLLAIKFLETYILLFTSDTDDPGKFNLEAVTPNGRAFNISWVVGGHPVLDPVALTSEANKYFNILLDLLRSASSLGGSLIIAVVNCLAGIARKRPILYNSVLSALLDLDPKFEPLKGGGHTTSIQYSIRTAFLGFLRCTHPTILESRDRLLRALRAMNAGDAADQIIRQVDKMLKLNERVSRDARVIKDEQLSNHLPASGDVIRKRITPSDPEESTNGYDLASKRTRYGPTTYAAQPVQKSDSAPGYSVNGVSSLDVPSLNNGLTPVEQMIAMIGALIAEGDRGAESLEILISNIHADLLADIVITNMKHLPRTPPPLTRLISLSETKPNGYSNGPAQVLAPISSTVSAQVPFSSSNAISTSLSDASTSVFSPSDSKRDPRRDPRRLDPRRVTSTPILEDTTNSMQPAVTKSEFEASVVASTDNLPKTETDIPIFESPVVSRADEHTSKDEVLEDEESKAVVPDVEDNVTSDISLSPIHKVDQDSVAATEPSDTTMIDNDDVYSSPSLEADQLSPSVSSTPISEEKYPDLPELPFYVDLTEEEKRNVKKLSVDRIINSYKHLRETDDKQTRMSLLARLVAQIGSDEDVVMMIQQHIVSDYQHQKGHELVMHVLYHLHTLMLSDSVAHSFFASGVYEKFLLGVGRSLLETLPATDKSFSRLLGEVPVLPDSALKLLDDVCCCSHHHFGKDGGRDGDSVTQGLGAVWSLILGRPLNRQACLDIALKCAVNSQDDIRAKAIRLVANKLYVINYISENIEQFATNMLLSVVDQRVSHTLPEQSGGTEQRTEGEIGSQETSISGSQISELATSENDSAKGDYPQSDLSVSFAQAQQHISLYFALCTKKPGLLQLVFDNYSRAPKAVKQAFHRHIPILVRALGSSYSELLHIISNPPQGSENLLTQVLNILSEGTVPSADLVATVRRLYETKLKDAAILIPMLPSFSKNEVLPIFPRLVDLPLDKFQTALANILQGTAHTGPALTPAEVLVAIHDINPDRDGIALKKITDACSACFEQRTVFTQQVLAKALNQMVDRTPLPLLFMRTVIQAIDAFPTLVDFVMEILSKLVSKQVWRMPKLWVGFLKCISQTQPHSFNVLLQLPSPQLEGALKKFANLRGPLAAYANQPSVKASLPWSTLALLGLANEASHMQQPHHPSSSLHSSETSSSIHGATLT